MLLKKYQKNRWLDPGVCGYTPKSSTDSCSSKWFKLIGYVYQMIFSNFKMKITPLNLKVTKNLDTLPAKADISIHFCRN